MKPTHHSLYNKSGNGAHRINEEIKSNSHSSYFSAYKFKIISDVQIHIILLNVTARQPASFILETFDSLDENTNG